MVSFNKYSVEYVMKCKIKMLYNEAKTVVIPKVDEIIRESWLTGQFGNASKITGVTAVLSARDAYPIFKIFNGKDDNFASADYYFDVVMEALKEDVQKEFGLLMTYKVINHLNYRTLELNLKEFE